MKMSYRILVIALAAIFFLLFYNSQIRSSKQLIENGQEVLLKLRPVDPRSLMQGDYMQLAYDADVYPVFKSEDKLTHGTAILVRGENNVATFSRLDNGAPLKPEEVKINFIKTINNQVSYGGNRYFFQEGLGNQYESAEYGIFRVSPSGQAILVGLADEGKQRIEPAKVDKADQTQP